MYHVEYLRQKEKQEELLSRKNEKSSFYNGIYLRWKNPVLTRDHVPLHWRYDLNPETNPFFLERLGVNAVFNAGAIYLDGKYCLVVRVEGNDRKSFFAVAGKAKTASTTSAFGKSPLCCRICIRMRQTSMICV